MYATRLWSPLFSCHFTTGRISNGPTEAVNLLIKKILPVDHGFKNFRNHRLRLLLYCGITWQHHTRHHYEAVYHARLERSQNNSSKALWGSQVPYAKTFLIPESQGSQREKEPIVSLTTEERIARIHDLDLEPIVFKLITPDGKEPAKMTLGEADNAVSLYRKFLILLLLHPSECIPPSLLIDEVWHAHILDTSKYRVDCDDIFGYYLDHFPYLGQRGPDDAARLQKAFATTQQLFMSEFGIDLSLTATNCGTCCPGACTDHIRGGLAQNERPRPDRNTPVLV